MRTMKGTRRGNQHTTEIISGRPLGGIRTFLAVFCESIPSRHPYPEKKVQFTDKESAPQRKTTPAGHIPRTNKKTQHQPRRRYTQPTRSRRTTQANRRWGPGWIAQTPPKKSAFTKQTRARTRVLSSSCAFRPKRSNFQIRHMRDPPQRLHIYTYCCTEYCFARVVWAPCQHAHRAH